MKKIYLFVITLILTSCPVFANDVFLSCIENENTSRQKTLIILYKTGCPYCEQMNVNISGDLQLQQYLKDNFRIYTLDINSIEGQNFANQFNIHAVPTIVNFNNETGAYNTIKGFGSKQRLLQELFPDETAGVSRETEPLNNQQGENLSAICGNGTVESGEQCDDGNTANGDGCSNTCTVQAGYQCSGNPSVCVAIAVCGNGSIEAGEQCDDGNITNGDGCSNTCTVQAGYQCTGNPSVCVAIAVCGNGSIEEGEQCDDGNIANGDGCSNTCTVQAGYQCTGTPSVCVAIAVCGNGSIDAGEQCDDGNIANGDGCSNTCTVQSGFQCTGSPSVCMPLEACGNGVIEATEQCDDGNTVNNDGCSSTCTIQSGYQCVGSPSVCVPIPVCGNGKLEAGEQCDDGNVAANDGCSESCQLENGDGAILVSKGAGTADYSAMLDVNSTQRGILIPRMTTAQRTAIKAPATGLMVFDATYNSFWYFGGNSWKEIKSDLLNAGFSASIPSATQNTSPGAPAFVAFPSEDFDDGGDNYNTGSSSYTVPSTGVYEFSATVSVNINASPAATSTYSINVYQSVGFTSIPIGSSTLVIPANYTGNATVSATGTVKLTAGNGGLVRVTITSSANTSAQQIVSGKFSGHRVY